MGCHNQIGGAWKCLSKILKNSVNVMTKPYRELLKDHELNPRPELNVT